MMDGKRIRIRILAGAPEAWLCLQGTILSYYERWPSRQYSVDIPVELVSFREGKRFRARRLIAALLSILVFLGIGGAVMGLWYLFSGSVPDAVSEICIMTGIAAGLISFLILFSYFLIRQTTISIYIASREAICFWLEKKYKHEIEELVQEIEARKSVVEETIPYPMSFALADVFESPWRRTLLLIFICLVPVILTQIPWLLFACLIPIGMHVRSKIILARQPILYRRAARHFLRREWRDALNAIKVLIRDMPDYWPARMFLIELSMRVDDFAGASAALSDVQDMLDAETLHRIQYDILIRKRIDDRKRLNAQADLKTH